MTDGGMMSSEETAATSQQLSLRSRTNHTQAHWRKVPMPPLSCVHPQLTSTSTLEEQPYVMPGAGARIPAVPALLRMTAAPAQPKAPGHPEALERSVALATPAEPVQPVAPGKTK
jgi:hypothetical protein